MGKHHAEGLKTGDIVDILTGPSDERIEVIFIKKGLPGIYVMHQQHGDDHEVPKIFYREWFRWKKVEPEEKPKYRQFTWEERDQLKDQWIYDKNSDCEFKIISMGMIKDFFWVNFDSDTQHSAGELLSHCVFVDTGEPVGIRI